MLPALGGPRPRSLQRSLLLAWTALALASGLWGQARAASNEAKGEAKGAAPRVLACYWGLDRATDVTFLGFQKVCAVRGVERRVTCHALT